MDGFDKYIKSILRNLQVSKNEKQQLYDEFKDHLQMMKQDFINHGLSEEAATIKAINSFGDCKTLKRGLSRNMNKFRTIPNILSGVILTILIFIVGNHIPVPDLDPDFFANGFNDYVLPIFLGYSGCVAFSFLPLGYYLPIVFKKAGNIKVILLIALLLGGVFGIAVCIPLGGLKTGIIVFCMFGGVLGGLLGFSVLNIINRLMYKLRYS